MTPRMNMNKFVALVDTSKVLEGLKKHYVTPPSCLSFPKMEIIFNILTDNVSQVKLVALKVDVSEVGLIKVFKNDTVIEASDKYETDVDVSVIDVATDEEWINTGDNNDGQPY
ncbi:unnamed protein product [Vicia faba]|uniref:Uncharacterized protein n=1 Tax=Vicia faba TaxID=3906 RepID=A0AAV0YUZ4_VICFA|nr:unnamed protein product [Vicia faba]